MSDAKIHRLSKFIALAVLAGLTLSACAGGSGSIYGPGPNNSYKIGNPYQINGVWYYPAEDTRYNKIGLASWYGREFQNEKTANGERFDRRRLTAAHPTLPMPVIVRVTNLDNGRTTLVRVNDRGPFAAGRIIDLSQAAAQELGFEQQGLTRVRVQYVGRADGESIALIPPKSGVSSAAADSSKRRIVVD